jgi:hypothetical protein
MSKFAVYLTVLFVGLKLAEIIHWSWWWVVSPVWIFAGICFVVVTLAYLMGILISAAAGKPDYN